MADFCKQCSIELLGEDYGGLKGLSTPEDTEKGLYVQVLCEGCGITLVDHEGTCVGNCDCRVNLVTGKTAHIHK